MKKLIILLAFVTLASAMEPELKPTPSLSGLPAELKNIIFESYIKRNPSIDVTPKTTAEAAEATAKAARDLKALLLINKQFSTFASDPTAINELIKAFGNNWTNNNFNEAANALLQTQPFEKNNISLATQLNKLIEGWKSNYKLFTDLVRNNEWHAVQYFIQHGYPIDDMVREIIQSIRLNKAQKEMKLETLATIGADVNVINRLKKELAASMNAGPTYPVYFGCMDDQGYQHD